jgi:peptidoglycan hydrolase-like protein with peptidoglycan-binding domain
MLHVGSRGLDVEELQTKLDSAGAAPPLVVDGIFGSKTRAAVVQFQQSRGLSPDGICGSMTWGALDAGGGQPTQPPQTQPPPTPPEPGKPNPVRIFVSGTDLGGAPDLDDPVAGAAVEITSADNERVHTAVTGSDGSVTILNSIVGPGRLRASKGPSSNSMELGQVQGVAEVSIVVPKDS